MVPSVRSLELPGPSVVVYQKPDDPSLTEVVVSIVTKMGMYLNCSQSSYIIGQGRVQVDGHIERDSSRVLRPGIHEFVVNDRKVYVDLREMESI
jgi:hypothetical protein